MRECDTIQQIRRERDYLSAQLDEATKDLARLDMLNLSLTRQKKQALVAFHLIRVLHERVEQAFTIGDLYYNAVAILTSELAMDACAVLKINHEARKISILTSVGLPENIKKLKLKEGVSKQELLVPTVVNSKSSPRPFQEFIRSHFALPYFVWYPFVDEENGTLILYAGNKFEDLVSRQPFSEESLETFGAISSVILLRRDNIAKTREVLRKKEERIDFLAEILKTSPISVVATDKDENITYCNPAMEKLFGYKEAELLGKHPAMLNAEPNAAATEKEIQDTVRRGGIWRGEIQCRKKNGDLFYNHLSVYQIRDREGNFIAMVGFQEDVTDRKRAEEALKESEETYRAIFENTGAATIIIEKDTTISLANAEFARFTGYSKEELEGKKSWMEFVARDDLATTKKYHDARRIDPNAAPRKYELKIVDRQGNVRETVATVDMIPGTKKSVASALDITERKRTTEALRKSEREKEAILNSILELVVYQDTDHRVVWANTVVHESVGLSAEQLLGRHCYKIWQDRSEPCTGCPVAKARETGKPHEGEMSSPDGRSWFIRSYPVRDANDDITGVVEVVLDMTESKRTQEKLREYEARYTHLLDNMPDGVALVSRRRIIRANPSMAQLFGYPSPESMDGLCTMDLSAPGSKRILNQRSTLRALGMKGRNRFEFQALRKDGETFSAEVTLTIDRNEPHPFVLAIIRDVTEMKAYEEQRKHLSEWIMLAQENERKLITRELHDRVGQSLSALGINLSIIRRQVSPDSAAEIVTRLDDSLRLVEETTVHIRDVMAELRPEVLDDYGLLAALGWYGDRFSHRSGVAAVVEVKDFAQRLPASVETALFRIAQEALTNVAKHARADQVNMTLEEVDGEVRLTIADDGVGFDLTGRRSPRKAPGWGLLIMRERAEAVGGQLLVESKPRKGTRVVVELRR